MSVFRKILVPTDFSRHAREAFRVAHDLARPTGARVVVLHVSPTPALVSDHKPLLSPPVDVEAKNRWSGLQKFQPKVPAVRVEHEMVEADRLDAKLILRTVRKRGCDSIVIGARVRTARKCRLFGSVTDQVVRGSHCPVIVVAAPAREAKDPAHEIADQPAARNVS